MGTSIAAEISELHPAHPRRWNAWWWLLFGLILCVAIGSFLVVTHVSRRQVAIAEIHRLGWFGTDSRPRGPAWLHETLPGDWIWWLGLREQTSAVLVGSQVTDAALPHVGRLSGLEQLWLTRTAITDAGLVHLAGLNELTFLALNGTDVTDASLKELTPLDRLVRLELSNTQITDTGLASLKSMTSLRALTLNGTEVSDSGIGHLLSLSSLEILDIERTRVTDQGIARLSGLPSLQTLSLDDAQLTETAQKQLAAFPSLETLHIDNRRVVELPDRQVELFDANLTMNNLAELLDSDPKRHWHFDDHGMRNDNLDFDRVLQEIVARGGTEAERLLLSKLQNADGELQGSRRHVVQLGLDREPRGVEARGEHRVENQVLYLAALRRLQRRPDPLSVSVSIPQPFSADTRVLPNIVVLIKSVDAERLALYTRLNPSPYRTERDSQWRLEVRDETGALLPPRQGSGVKYAGEVLPEMGWLRFGESVHASLPMGEFVRIPKPGEYTVTILYRPSGLPGSIADIEAHEDAQSLITFRSAPFVLKVDQAPKQRVPFSKADREKGISLIGQLPVKRDESILYGGPPGQEGLGQIAATSPTGQLLAMEWRAVPALLAALADAELSVDQQATILELLYVITAERDMNPLLFDPDLSLLDLDLFMNTEEDLQRHRRERKESYRRLIALWRQFADEYLEFFGRGPVTAWHGLASRRFQIRAIPSRRREARPVK